MKSRVPVGDYRVYVDLMLNSRRPDFVNRMISTIPLGVLAGLASISLFSREIMPMPINSSQSPVPDRLSDRSCSSGRTRPFLSYPAVPAHPAVTRSRSTAPGALHPIAIPVSDSKPEVAARNPAAVLLPAIFLPSPPATSRFADSP